MKKEEIIERYGEEAYAKLQMQTALWQKAHREEMRKHGRKWARAHSEENKERNRKWRKDYPEKQKAKQHEGDRKGGKYYEKKLKYQQTGIPGERATIRKQHANKWGKYKVIKAPDSELHHQWIPGTAKYGGIALVEKDQHQRGIINVIQIMEGEITLFSEEDIRRGCVN